MNQVASFSHIRQSFHFDNGRKFQALRKIREAYLYLNNQNRLKMKVCVPARTLSQTVASCIESIIACETNKLPSEAINTAEFVHDIDNLFESFIGRNPKGKMGKPFRKCLSKKSPHNGLWSDLSRKINSWTFIKESREQKEIPFKTGWLT